MRWMFRRYAAFRRWSNRVDDRFAGTAFFVRILTFAALVVCVANPGGVIMEFRGMHRARSLGASIGPTDQLVCAFHEAGHAIVGRALDPHSFLTGLVVIDRSSSDDALYYGYTASIHAFTVLPNWLVEGTAHDIMTLLAETQGGVAVEAFIMSRSCDDFANRVGEVVFDNDTVKVLEMLEAGYGLRYRVGWQYDAHSFGKDARLPGEVRAARMLAEVRRVALGTAIANRAAISALALKTIFTPVRHGWHVVGENELSAITKKHPLVIARCR